MIIVVTLLCYGCPIQAIVQAYGLDERTVADWQKRAGKQCQQVHQAIVEQGKVQTHHIQADEIRAKVKKTEGRGRCSLEVWPDLCIATVIKRTHKKRVVEVTRKLAWGAIENAHKLLAMTVGCKQFNTSWGRPRKHPLPDPTLPKRPRGRPRKLA